MTSCGLDARLSAFVTVVFGSWSHESIFGPRQKFGMIHFAAGRCVVFMRRLGAIGLIASLISEKAMDRNVSLSDLCCRLSTLVRCVERLFLGEKQTDIRSISDHVMVRAPRLGITKFSPDNALDRSILRAARPGIARDDSSEAL